MRYCCFLCLFLLSGSVLAGPVLDDDAVTTHRQVTWDDFRGSLTSWGPEQARIATRIVLEPLEVELIRNGDGTWTALPENPQVYALMDKLTSAYRPGGRNDRALAHEQGHFDITEYYARLLHARIVGLQTQGEEPFASEQRLRRRVHQAYEEIHQEWQAAQKRYDGETRHGSRRGQQKKWLERIAVWLQETEPY